MDVWSAQAKCTFAKAKTDWFNGTEYNSRLHLSFVEHKGKPKCEQVKAIEIGIPMVKAGSNGNGQTGITALGLAHQINSGILAKKAALARKKAQEQNQPYADEIWACIGGTTAKRSKNGVPEFRKVSIAPGNKPGTYVLKASSCEGEQSSALGGVTPKKGVPWTHILVPVDSEYMDALGTVIVSEWTAFRMMHYTAPAENTGSSNTAEMPQPNQRSNQPAKAAPANHNMIWTFYDQTFFGPMAIAFDKDQAVVEAQKCFARLSKEKGLICKDKHKGAAFKEQILSCSTIQRNAILTPVEMVLKTAADPNGRATDYLMCMFFYSDTQNQSAI